jgi:hypothetical protein
MLNWSLIINVLVLVLSSCHATSDAPTSAPSLGSIYIPPTTTKTHQPTIAGDGEHYDAYVKHTIVGYGIIFSIVGFCFCVFLFFYTVHWFNTNVVDDPDYMASHLTSQEMEKKNRLRKFQSMSFGAE